MNIYKMASPSIRNLAKTGFGLGLGFFASHIIFILIGLAFFIPGLLMVRKSKENHEKTSTNYVIGMILLVLGVIIMGGLGLSTVIDNI